jgi:hypothetical protein
MPLELIEITWLLARPEPADQLDDASEVGPLGRVAP